MTANHALTCVISSQTQAILCMYVTLLFIAAQCSKWVVCSCSSESA